mmetsp:Transcript_7733/g.16133  ORF Transcript_7733/g.16133 Transcript_7733/m.16133 type:complete len:263 (-) Transcript_7733:168-956(-)
MTTLTASPTPVELARNFFFGARFGHKFVPLLNQLTDTELQALGQACILVAGHDGTVSRDEGNYIAGLLALYGASPTVLNHVVHEFQHPQKETTDKNNHKEDLLTKEVMPQFQVFNAKIVLWHALKAAASDGLHPDEMKAFHAVAAEQMGLTPRVVQDLLDLVQASDQALTTQLQAVFPRQEDRWVAAAQPAAQEEDAIHIADSRIFAGRPETSAVFAEYTEETTRQAAQSFFFWQEWGMPTVPPPSAFPLGPFRPWPVAMGW